jgi:hypothetical protein
MTSARAPVLRITTARYPGAARCQSPAPFLHSAFMEICVPGENPRHFIRGHIRAPIHVETGVIMQGIWFLNPDERYDFLPWNRAPLAGRAIPFWPGIAGAALQAMELVPHLALVNWDMILTGTGPVFLDGNTCGDWILTNLSQVAGIPAEPLAPLLRKWQTEFQP